MEEKSNEKEITPPRRKVTVRRSRPIEIPNVWIVVLSHATINLSEQTSSNEEKVVAMEKEVILEKVPPRINLRYQSSCSCPSVVTCDEDQTDTMLSYAHAWELQDIMHERALQSRVRAKNVTRKQMEEIKYFPPSTEETFLKEMGEGPFDSVCEMVQTEYLLDKSFSSEVPFKGNDMFAGSIYMFYNKEPNPDETNPDETNPAEPKKRKSRDTRSKRRPGEAFMASHGLMGRTFARGKSVSKIRKSSKEVYERSVSKLFNAPFLFPLLVNSMAYYHECSFQYEMPSLNSVFPSINHCEMKMISAFPNSQIAIREFFRENKEKEEYMTRFETTPGNIDLDRLHEKTQEYDELAENPIMADDYPQEELEEIDEIITNRKHRTNVRRILTLVKSLFPNGANVSFIDYSCNNFSTDEVGCDFENEMLAALLRRKKETGKKLHFGGRLR